MFKLACLVLLVGLNFITINGLMDPEELEAREVYGLEKINFLIKQDLPSNDLSNSQAVKEDFKAIKALIKRWKKMESRKYGDVGLINACDSMISLIKLDDYDLCEPSTESLMMSIDQKCDRTHNPERDVDFIKKIVAIRRKEREEKCKGKH